ncbi:hypothetical protein VST49_00005, partial [Pseudomonas aeruginosa]
FLGMLGMHGSFTANLAMHHSDVILAVGARFDDKVKQQVAKEEAERKQFCEETRNNLAQLKNNPRVRVDEGKGELRRLGEEERQERIAKAEKAIQENCR